MPKKSPQTQLTVATVWIVLYDLFGLPLLAATVLIVLATSYCLIMALKEEKFSYEEESDKAIEAARRLGVWPEPLKLHRKL